MATFVVIVSSVLNIKSHKFCNNWCITACEIIILRSLVTKEFKENLRVKIFIINSWPIAFYKTILTHKGGPFKPFCARI